MECRLFRKFAEPSLVWHRGSVVERSISNLEGVELLGVGVWQGEVLGQSAIPESEPQQHLECGSACTGKRLAKQPRATQMVMKPFTEISLARIVL